MTLTGAAIDPHHVPVVIVEVNDEQHKVTDADLNHLLVNLDD